MPSRPLSPEPYECLKEQPNRSTIERAKERTTSAPGRNQTHARPSRARSRSRRESLLSRSSGSAASGHRAYSGLGEAREVLSSTNTSRAERQNIAAWNEGFASSRMMTNKGIFHPPKQLVAGERRALKVNAGTPNHLSFARQQVAQSSFQPP